MRRTVGVTLMVLLLLSFAAPAQAAVSAVGIDYAICNGPCADGNGITSFTGFITCTNGEIYTIRANMRQGGETIAVGRASGTCTGSSQNWTTNRVDNPGSLDCNAAFNVGGKATSQTGGKRIPNTQFFCF